MNEYYMTDEQRALADAALANRLNVIHHVYVDITGDLVAGALLGQILYWFGADRNGRPRARIQKEGYLWIAKARSDWWEEIRISAKQYDRAAKILKDKGFIVLKTMKFNGNPTTHIRINPVALNQAIDSWKLSQVADLTRDGVEDGATSGYSPFGNNDFHQRGIAILPKSEVPYNRMGNNDVPRMGTTLTENTTKNTNENTTKNTNTSESVSFEDVWKEYPKKIGKTKARCAYEKAIQEGVNPLLILVQCAIYRQYIEQQCSEGLQRRFIQTGGAWFDSRGWEDDIPTIGASLGYDAGTEYNLCVSKLRKFAKEGDRKAVKRLLLELPY